MSLMLRHLAIITFALLCSDEIMFSMSTTQHANIIYGLAAMTTHQESNNHL